MKRFVGLFLCLCVEHVDVVHAFEDQRPRTMLHPNAPPLMRPLKSPDSESETFVLPAIPPNDQQGGIVADRRRYVIKAFVFEGATVISENALQDIAKPFAGRAVTIADIESLRQRLTQCYIDRGYVTSGAVIPANALSEDGRLRIRIVEGRLDDVWVHGQERLDAQYIKQRLIDSDEALNLNQLRDRYQGLLADPLIERMRGRLLPGSELGHSILDVEVTRARPYQITLLGNNYRPPSIGAEGGGFSSWVRNLTGWGDVLDFTVLASEGGERYAGGWSVPLGASSTQLFFRFDEGEAAVIEEPLALVGIRSRIHIWEAGIYQPLIDNLQRHVGMGTLFTVRENQTELLGRGFAFVPVDDDGYTQASVWRFYQEYTERFANQGVALRSTFNVGLDMLGATTETDARYPDSEFFSWLGQVQYVWQDSDNRSQWVLLGNLQLSNEALLPLEQMAIGGIYSVRGYRENQRVRDQGFNATIEYHYPLWGGAPGAKHKLTLIPFMDYGEAWNIDSESSRLHALGLGFNWRFHALQAEFYWAHPLVDAEPKMHGNLQDDGIHFQVKLDLF